MGMPNDQGRINCQPKLAEFLGHLALVIGHSVLELGTWNFPAGLYIANRSGAQL
jgi:hypothetical protein